MDNYTDFQGPFTVWAWFTQDEAGDLFVLAARSGSWMLCTQSDSYNGKLVLPDGSAELPGSYSDGSPVFVCGVYDGTQATVYVNDQASDPVDCSLGTPNAALELAYEYGSSGLLHVHKIGFANRALSYSEVGDLYTEGA